MDTLFTEFVAAVAAASVLTIGFVQLVKAQGVPKRLYPVASVVSGLVMMGLYRLAEFADWTLFQTVVAGLISAMIAGGVWSGGKAVLGRGDAP